MISPEWGIVGGDFSFNGRGRMPRSPLNGVLSEVTLALVAKEDFLGLP